MTETCGGFSLKAKDSKRQETQFRTGKDSCIGHDTFHTDNFFSKNGNTENVAKRHVFGYGDL